MNTSVAEQRRQNQDVAIEAKEAGEFQWDYEPVRGIVVLVPVEAVSQVGINAPQIDGATQVSLASSFPTGTAANWWYAIVDGNRRRRLGKSSKVQSGTSLFFLTECKRQGTSCEDFFRAHLLLNASLNSGASFL